MTPVTMTRCPLLNKIRRILWAHFPLVMTQRHLATLSALKSRLYKLSLCVLTFATFPKASGTLELFTGVFLRQCEFMHIKTSSIEHSSSIPPNCFGILFMLRASSMYVWIIRFFFFVSSTST